MITLPMMHCTDNSIATSAVATAVEMASGSAERDADGGSYDYLQTYFSFSSKDADGRNVTFLCTLYPPALKKQV